MGYKIEYGQTMEITHLKDAKTFSAGKVLILVLITVIILCTYSMKDKVIDLLIPGNTEVTKTAISEMIQSLEDGVEIKDAVTAFCAEIIEHANIS